MRRPHLPDSLSPLADARFAWYFTGRLISTTGTVMAPIAITFAVLDLTDSASALGGVLAARFIPLIAFMLIGGVVADRFSRSIVMQLSHLLSAATQGMVAVLLLTGTAEIWMIVVLEAVNGTVAAFTFPAMFGVVPQVVPRSHIQQANALLGFTRNGLNMIGPSIGAVLVVTVGSGWAVAIDALTWLVAAGCMAQVKLPAAVTRAADAAKPSMWRDLVDGWSTFTSFTWVWVVVVAFGLMNAIQAGAWSVLGPVVAKDTIGIPAWGWVLSASAAGYLVMTVVLMQWRLTYPVRAGMIGASLFALPIVMLGYDAQVVPLVLAAFVAGAGMEVFSIGWQTAYHEHIPNEYLSRVTSYDALGSFVAIPVGALAFGPLADAFGIRDVVITSGVAFAAISLLALLSRSVRDLPRAAPESEDESSGNGGARPSTVAT
jgi:MFS family permease